MRNVVEALPVKAHNRLKGIVGHIKGKAVLYMGSNYFAKYMHSMIFGPFWKGFWTKGLLFCILHSARHRTGSLLNNKLND